MSSTHNLSLAVPFVCFECRAVYMSGTRSFASGNTVVYVKGPNGETQDRCVWLCHKCKGDTPVVSREERRRKKSEPKPEASIYDLSDDELMERLKARWGGECPGSPSAA